MNIKVNRSFDIKDIMECGQAFRYERLDDGHYDLIAYGKRIRVQQSGEQVELSCSEEAFDQLWKGYFDLSSDYEDMQNQLIGLDERMASYIGRKPGIRILRQEPFEMLITFILSQNKAMPQIKLLVKRISETYGDILTDVYGTYYAFPRPEQLAGVSEADFRALKVGFRAPYLVDAIHKVVTGRLDLEALWQGPTEEARETLMTVKGVGRKVSDCVLLFAYHRMDVFPLDVWMKRAVSQLYFNDQKVSDQVMLDFAAKTFGDLSGIAQQYLFYGTVDQA